MNEPAIAANENTVHVLSLYTKSLRKHAKWVRAQEAPWRLESLDCRRQRIDLLRKQFEDARDEHVRAVMALGRRS